MIEESSWFGTQLQSISKERLLPTRDSLLGIIRRKERPLNSGIYETYGSHVHGTSCLQNWLCGLAHGTVNIRNHKSPEFPQQRKRPCLRIASLEVSSWKRPWVSSSATCAFSTFHSLPSPTSSSSSSPPSPLILDVDISVGLTVINDASANPSRGKRPSPWQRPARDPQAALDNGTDHISMRETKGSWFFFFFCPWKTRGVTPLSDYVAFKGLKKKQTFLYPQGNSWDAELQEGPFRNFLGACHGNQHSRVFICPKIESSTGSLSWVLKSKVDSFSRRNLKGRKGKVEMNFSNPQDEVSHGQDK